MQLLLIDQVPECLTTEKDVLARFVGIWMVFVIHIAVGVEGIAYGDACTGGGSGDCTEKTNIVCDTTCKCSSSTFRKTTAAECAAKVTVLDGTCDAADSASDQCTVTNAECRNGGTGSKCLCKATHYVDGAACTLRKKPSQSCAANQCVTHATCTSGTNICECNAGYTASPTTSPTMCSGVVKVITLPYMYVVPILVSMMCLLR